MLKETESQTWGILTKVLFRTPITNNELDTLKKRLCSFLDILSAYNITIADIQNISDIDEFMVIINLLKPTDLATIFY